LNGVLHQLQTIISVAGDKTQSQDEFSAETVANKLTELRDIMDQSGESTTNIIEALKNSSSNPGSNYYWLIFVLLYGGVYFFQ
jgi:replication-associated recombination protein RarA